MLPKVNANSHVFENVCNASEDIGLCRTSTGIVNAWGIDDYDTLSANPGF